MCERFLTLPSHLDIPEEPPGDLGLNVNHGKSGEEIKKSSPHRQGGPLNDDNLPGGGLLPLGSQGRRDDDSDLYRLLLFPLPLLGLRQREGGERAERKGDLP